MALKGHMTCRSCHPQSPKSSLSPSPNDRPAPAFLKHSTLCYHAGVCGHCQEDSGLLVLPEFSCMCPLMESCPCPLLSDLGQTLLSSQVNEDYQGLLGGTSDSWLQMQQ